MSLKRCWLAVLLVTGGLVLAWAMLAANEKQAETETAAKKPDEIIDEAMTAYKVAEIGRKHTAPEALLTAATILRGLRNFKLTQLTDKPKIEGEGSSVPVPIKSFDDEANELFEEAKLTAATQKLPGLDAFITAIKQRSTRDVVGGPKTIRYRIGPGQTNVWHVSFVAGKPATIGFSASAPLTLVVKNDESERVWLNGQFTNKVDAFIPPGKPDQEVSYSFKIDNHEKQAHEYRLLLK